MATLAVHEAMGMKVEREAVATLVLPQLWAMSMGPCKFHYKPLQETLREDVFDSAEHITVQTIHGSYQEAWRSG